MMVIFILPILRQNSFLQPIKNGFLILRFRNDWHPSLGSIYFLIRCVETYLETFFFNFRWGVSHTPVACIYKLWRSLCFLFDVKIPSSNPYIIFSSSYEFRTTSHHIKTNKIDSLVWSGFLAGVNFFFD